jgi:hypothetical protein
MRARGSIRGPLGFHRVTTLFRPLFLGSDRSAPCADFQERSDFGSGSPEPLVGLELEVSIRQIALWCHLPTNQLLGDEQRFLE